MRFPCSFSRVVQNAGGAGTTLGTDTVPTGLPNASLDNVLNSKFYSVLGWPVHRIAITYNGPAATVTGRLFFFEESTGKWYKIGADLTLTSGSITFADNVALLEPPPIGISGINSLQASSSGSMQVFLQVDATVTNGTYLFAMAADLSTPN